LHPQSGNEFFEIAIRAAQSGSDTIRKMISKRDCKKKVLEKFGGSKYLIYLCTTFRYENTNGDFSNGSLIYWFLMRENCSIYLSIL